MKRFLLLSAVYFLCQTAALAQAGAPTAVPATPPPPAPGLQRPTIVSPQVLPDGKVAFRLYAPDAQNVQLRGEWPGGGQRTSLPMTKGDDGVWSVTATVPPQYWGYHFSVDGVAAVDPQNGLVRHANMIESTLLVDGPISSRFEVKDVPHGTVSAIWVPTPSLKENPVRRTWVYTPPGYEAGKTRYPVLYLMHGGGGGNEDTWLEEGRAPQILDNLIASGRALPMIVVMPNTNPDQAASANYVKPRQPSTLDLQFAGFDPWSKALYSDFIPAIDRLYRTQARPESRAIAGLSMGAAASIYFAGHHPETAAWIGVFSCGCLALPHAMRVIDEPASADHPARQIRTIDRDVTASLLPRLDAKANAQLRLLYITMGDNDGLKVANQVLLSILDERKVHYTFNPAPGYAHEFSYWRINLEDFAQRIFQ
jgi:enterochelin esterase-like enzyme